MIGNPKTIAALAAGRLADHRAPEVDARIAEASQAMRAAMVRLDWREARKQAEIWRALNGNPRPMTAKEQEKLLEKVARLVAEATAVPAQPRLPG
jgi:hypothetical protein